jgi:hypothetical protein
MWKKAEQMVRSLAGSKPTITLRDIINELKVQCQCQPLMFLFINIDG